MSRAPVLTAEERSAKMSDAMGKVAGAVSRLATGEDWRNWLKFSATLARKHRYSPRNTIWLLEQAMMTGRDDLEIVGGYRWWQSVGRQVRKGESAYWVLAPITAKVPDREHPEELHAAVVGFKCEAVFALHQTDGDELPAPPPAVLPAGEGPENAWTDLSRLLTTGGWVVTREPIAEKDVQGFTKWSTRRVVVRDDIAPAAAAYVLMHEAAHVYMHEGSSLPRATKEVEADSCAYLLADAIGLDAGSSTFPYVTGWSGGDPTKVLAVADRASKAAEKILADLVAI